MTISQSVVLVIIGFPFNIEYLTSRLYKTNEFIIIITTIIFNVFWVIILYVCIIFLFVPMYSFCSCPVFYQLRLTRSALVNRLFCGFDCGVSAMSPWVRSADRQRNQGAIGWMKALKQVNHDAAKYHVRPPLQPRSASSALIGQRRSLLTGLLLARWRSSVAPPTERNGRITRVNISAVCWRFRAWAALW